MRQTPEKQLLKLIEESKVNKSKEVSLSSQIIKYKTLSFFSLKAWQSRFIFLLNSFSQGIRHFREHPFDLKLLNRILEVLLCILVISFINSLISLGKLSQRVIEIKFKPKELKNISSIENNIQSKPTLSYYLEKISQRDIFSMIKKEPSIEAPPSSKIIEMTQHLKLVGISWSNDPDAMIEDSKAMRTFFVKRGQMIGEIKVEEIYKDKIILSYGGEKIELK